MPLESRSLTTKLYQPHIAGDLAPRPACWSGVQERKGRPLAAALTPVMLDRLPI
jgi:hypothetical protein